MEQNDEQGASYGSECTMSGGHFEYLCFKADNEEIFTYNSLVQLEAMEAHLKAIGKEDAAKVIGGYKDAIVAVRNSAFEYGERLYELLHNVEWQASGDYGVDAIDNAMTTLHAKEQAPQPQNDV